MLKNLALLTLSFLVTLPGVYAQDEDDRRYLDAQFEVMTPTTDTFATNISVLTGAPVAKDLTVDVYMPMEDTATDRAVVAIFPTGNFLPAYINQGVYGSKGDSANVYLAQQLAARGFVTMVAEYRQGWRPDATDQIVQTETLLKAAYRGGQDAKALARYLRKTVAEDDNPYGIDEDKIAFWGFGTGGYVVLTHAFLDSIAEIELNEQFYDTDGNLLVSEATDGNVQGTTDAPLNQINNPDYSDNVALTVMAGGAIGDTSWIGSGPNNTDAMIAMHRVEDPFAPYNIGAVIVPTTNSTVINDVGGGHAVVRISNREGINDGLDAANETELDERFSELSEELNALNEQYKEMMLGSTDFPLSYDNLFPFVGDGGHWNWANEAAARQFIAAINASGAANLDADVIINTEKMLNPNFDDPAAAKRTIDTMVAFFIPRAFYALDLISTSVDYVAPTRVDLNIFPNPALTGFTVRVAPEHTIRQIDIFDLNGRQLRSLPRVDAAQRFVERHNLPRGQYVIRIQLDEGVTAQKLYLH